jgi:hypothetical protein
MEKANPSGIMKYCTVDGIGYIELKLLEESWKCTVTISAR